MSETRKYRKFSAQQKTEIVLASLRGPKSVAELCREHEISDSLLRKWRDQFLAAGAERLQGKSERTEVDELRARVSKLERALGRKTMEVEVAGELLRGWEGGARRPVPRAGRCWTPRGGRGACCAYQPPVALPPPGVAAHGPAPAAEPNRSRRAAG